MERVKNGRRRKKKDSLKNETAPCLVQCVCTEVKRFFFSKGIKLKLDDTCVFWMFFTHPHFISVNDLVRQIQNNNCYMNKSYIVSFSVSAQSFIFFFTNKKINKTKRSLQSSSNVQLKPATSSTKHRSQNKKYSKNTRHPLHNTLGSQQSVHILYLNQIKDYAEVGSVILSYPAIDLGMNPKHDAMIFRCFGVQTLSGSIPKRHNEVFLIKCVPGKNTIIAFLMSLVLSHSYHICPRVPNFLLHLQHISLFLSFS